MITFYDRTDLFDFAILHIRSTIIDVTQFWSIYDPLPPIVTLLITKTLELSAQNP